VIGSERLPLWPSVIDQAIEKIPLIGDGAGVADPHFFSRFQTATPTKSPLASSFLGRGASICM
jgi:hypothetical protein